MGLRWHLLDNSHGIPGKKLTGFVDPWEQGSWAIHPRLRYSGHQKNVLPQFRFFGGTELNSAKKICDSGGGEGYDARMGTTRILKKRHLIARFQQIAKNPQNENWSLEGI